MNADLSALSVAAVSIGFVHTLFGPDHYLPFVAMSRAGGWSKRKTLIVTLLCGVGHVGSSVLLGFIGLALGLIVFQLETMEGRLETIESQRGNVAGWLLIAFGVVYTSWGLVQAVRNRSHTHLHVHPDGTVHTHEHVHVAEHLHPHAELGQPAENNLPHGNGGADVAQPPSAVPRSPLATANPAEGGWATWGRLFSAGCPASVDTEGPTAPATQSPYVSPGVPAAPQAVSAPSLTPWILFAIFAFGPCEPLIPLLMYPAAKADLFSAAWVTALFALATLATMTTMVLAISAGTEVFRFDKLTRFSHALAGFVVLSCGVAVKAGF